MAMADYRKCDVCGGKAFYDARLNYHELDSWNEHIPPYRVAGKDQYENAEILSKHGDRLDYVGDWAVICTDCAKTHKTQIVQIDRGETNG